MAKKDKHKVRGPISDEDCLAEEELSDTRKAEFILSARRLSVSVEGPDSSLVVFVLTPASEASDHGYDEARQEVEQLLADVLTTFGIHTAECDFDDALGRRLCSHREISLQLDHGILNVVSIDGFVQRSQFDRIEVRHPTVFRKAAKILGGTVEAMYHALRDKPAVAHSSVYIQAVRSELLKPNGAFARLMELCSAIVVVQRPSIAQQDRPALDDRVANPSIARFQHLVVAAPDSRTRLQRLLAR